MTAFVDRAQYTNGARRRTPRKDVQEGDRRCWSCDKFLLRVADFRGSVEIACRGCKRINVILSEEPWGPGLGVPIRDEIVAEMDKRWQAQIKAHSIRRAELAVGLRFKVFQRDGFRCRYCGASASDGALLHADHVHPVSLGGATMLDNLVTACIDCNLGKSDTEIAALDRMAIGVTK